MKTAICILVGTLVVAIFAAVWWAHREQARLDEKRRSEGKPLYWF